MLLIIVHLHIFMLWHIPRIACFRDLSSIGIKSYQIVRAVPDQNSGFHHRAERSSKATHSELRLILQSIERNLTLILNDARSIFAQDAVIHLASDEFLSIDNSILYQGYVLDHPYDSVVTGGFYSNWFDGFVRILNETWHIEPISRYGITSDDQNLSIIYNVVDIDFNQFDNRRFCYGRRSIDNNEKYQTSPSFCGLHDERKRKVMEYAHNRIIDDGENKSSRLNRTKRALNVNTTDERTCCNMFIRIDPTLWNLIYENEGLQEKQATIHALVVLLYRTITASNEIYQSIKFEHDNDVLYRFTIQIKRIRIMMPDDCNRTDLNISEKNLCRSNLNSETLLTWHSAENFTEYCLAYLFTARNLENGTLGLAWIASLSSNSRGGICEKSARDVIEGKRVIKTLNTGFVSLINHNTRISSLMTGLAFAHELAHSLGAEHDDEECDQYQTHGHFLMYRRTNTGLEINNRLLSNCSLQKMAPILIAVKNEQMGRVNCLIKCYDTGSCGNRIKENGEECDCGFSSECIDPCCYPADNIDRKLACRLKSNATCSPSMGPCCFENCTLRSSLYICHRDMDGQDCINDVRCDGTQATCPSNNSNYFKPTDTPCHNHTALCDRGICNKSVCTLIGKDECSLELHNFTDLFLNDQADLESLCQIACFDHATNTCVDTNKLRFANNHSSSGFGYKHALGHQCAGSSGYCDAFGKCRLIDAVLSLNQSRKHFLSEENRRRFTKLFRHYWWAFAICCLGLLGFLSICIKLCTILLSSRNSRRNPTQRSLHSMSNDDEDETCL